MKAGQAAPIAPAPFRLLHPVLAKQKLTGFQHRIDAIIRLLLRDRD